MRRTKEEEERIRTWSDNDYPMEPDHYCSEEDEEEGEVEAGEIDEI